MIDKQEFFFDPTHSSYIQVTSQTIFERKLLDQLTFQIVFSGATLDESRLAAFLSTDLERVHNAESLTWKLNEKRVEDGWFLYQLIMFYKDECGSLNSTDLALN